MYLYPTAATALTYEEVCDRIEVSEHFMKELSTIAKSHGLQGWEVPGQWWATIGTSTFLSREWATDSSAEEE